MIFLLDVNVLIALAWPEHSAHALVQRWFARVGSRGWATCPFTEAGFVRILSNPAFSGHALAPVEAVEALRVSARHANYHFWSDDIGFEQATQAFKERITGHQQVTDAYLLGLAMHKRGKLATLDGAILNLLSGRQSGNLVEIIGQ